MCILVGMDHAHPYIPNSVPEVRAAMLVSVGAVDVEEFYADIPADLRLHRPLLLPEPMRSEAELVRHVGGLLDRNVDGLSFLGGGCYPHHVPAVCDEVNGRAEFLTAYAGEPYEDHGRFQALWEYQSLMGELLELDVVNVPTYDGYQAAATSIRMAGRVTGRSKVLLGGPVSPDKLSKITDYLRGAMTFTDALDEDTACVFLEYPNHHGVIDVEAPTLVAAAHAAGALAVVSCNPMALGVLASPASFGADIVCGDIQPLGMHMQYGGGQAGFIATRDDERLVMEFPSRLFGLVPTVVDGEYGFGDVAYDRTSFGVREEGKEWVGTAAALWGITAGVYLSLMGPTGMREIGSTIMARTAYAMRLLGAIPGVTLPNADDPHFCEFVVEFVRPVGEILDALRDRGIFAGLPLDGHRALVCVTEVHTQADIELLAASVREVLA
ncbi:glycine dehydrogenase [Longispora fulva]|nr:glycine dehydrogenase [Longispora fulva]